MAKTGVSPTLAAVYKKVILIWEERRAVLDSAHKTLLENDHGVLAIFGN